MAFSARCEFGKKIDVLIKHIHRLQDFCMCDIEIKEYIGALEFQVIQLNIIKDLNHSLKKRQHLRHKSCKEIQNDNLRYIS